MNENFKRKEELANKLGMEPCEAFELFSEATLTSMELGKIVGGNDDVNICPTLNLGKCGQCPTTNGAPCDVKGVVCASFTLPSLPPFTPTLPTPTLATLG